MTCHKCKVKCNTREWKRGLERWFYETHGRIKWWFCESCIESEDGAA